MQYTEALPFIEKNKTRKNYKSETTEHAFFLMRWLHKKRFLDAVKLLNLKKDDYFLDYGCGDGTLMQYAENHLPKEHIYGYEPSSKMIYEARENTDDNYAITKHLQYLPNISFNKICCLETCEHLTDQKCKELFTHIKNLSTKNATILISVPIEIGIPSLLKNVFRFITKKDISNLNAKNVLLSLCKQKIPREMKKKLGDIDYIYSHIGFDYRSFEIHLKEHFHIETKHYSPFFLGKNICNFTVYYTLQR